MVKVLVVEDEASIREMIALNLRLAGMEAVEADSAEAALPLLEQRPGCDAAILDVMLPGMNGFSLCETIRRTDQKIGIIILSANGSPLGSNGDDRRQWRKQGGTVGAAASRMRARAKQMLGAATRLWREAPERANSAGTATGRAGNPGPLWSHPGRALPASGGTPPHQGGSIPQRSRWTKPAAG